MFGFFGSEERLNINRDEEVGRHTGGGEVSGETDGTLTEEDCCARATPGGGTDATQTADVVGAQRHMSTILPFPLPLLSFTICNLTSSKSRIPCLISTPSCLFPFPSLSYHSFLHPCFSGLLLVMDYSSRLIESKDEFRVNKVVSSGGGKGRDLSEVTLKKVKGADFDGRDRSSAKIQALQQARGRLFHKT